MIEKIKDLKGKLVHFIGIGGISMSALAQILKRNGCIVQGSDLAANAETKILERKKIKIFHNHSADNLVGVDIVVYSSAIHEDNEELRFARENNLVIIKRAELLGIIARDYKVVISVAGSHGKTTTTAMIAEMFERAKLKPTIHIGGKDNYIKSNYKLGNKKYFITEACEYMDNFLYISSDIAIILNVDSDHLDYFKNLDRLKASFYKFSKNVRSGGAVIVNRDDPNLKEIQSGDNVTLFGLTSGSEIYAKNIKEYSPCRYSFDAYFCGAKLGNIKLPVFGKHNISNALVVILVGIACDIDFCEIVSSIENFSGVERRCEIVGSVSGALIIHDYAHHPRQIEKMMDVAKDYVRASGGKIITVFEPHTFSRTKYLLEDFAKSFEGSSIVLLAPVYSAREREEDGKNSKDLENKCLEYVHAEFLGSYPEIEEKIKATARDGDIVMVLGAGTIEKLAKELSDNKKCCKC